MIAAIVIVVAWQLASVLALVNPVFASSPTAVAKETRAMFADGTLGPALASSTKLFLVGFAVSLVLGLLLGVLLGSVPIADAALDPLISFLYAAPRIALVPLVMLWTGIGFESRVVMVVISGVFPILINVASGVRAVDRQLVSMTTSFGGRHLQLLRWVAIPGAVPAIVAGVRQGVVMCLIGVVIAEYFIGGTGVGGLIVTAGQTLNTAQAYVGVIFFAVAAILLTAVLRVVERRVDAWRA